VPNNSEGYVKYTALHIPGPAAEDSLLQNLNEIRTRLYDMGLLGVLPGGVGYGNVSIRFKGPEFLISGTGTGADRILGFDKYCLVRAIDIDNNSISSFGPVRASAESMTHGIIYQRLPAVNSVIHIHSRRIFDGMLRDDYSSTLPDAEYGTPEMARAIIKVINDGNGQAEGIIVLAGHDEGVVSYGPTVERTFSLIQKLNDKYGGKTWP